MNEEVYYQKRFFNKDLGKEITYCYNYREIRKGARRNPIVFGLASGEKEVRSFLFTFIVVMMTSIVIQLPFIVAYNLIAFVTGLNQYRLIDGLITWTMIFGFLFISYAIVVPRFINLNFFRKIMDMVLLGRLKKKIG